MTAPKSDPVLRYQPTPLGFQTHNGRRSFNRPLYGNNSPFMAFAGDLPKVYLAPPANC